MTRNGQDDEEQDKDGASHSGGDAANDGGDVNDDGGLATLPDEAPKLPSEWSMGHTAASLTSYVCFIGMPRDVAQHAEN